MSSPHLLSALVGHIAPMQWPIRPGHLMPSSLDTSCAVRMEASSCPGHLTSLNLWEGFCQGIFSPGPMPHTCLPRSSCFHGCFSSALGDFPSAEGMAPGSLWAHACPWACSACTSFFIHSTGINRGLTTCQVWFWALGHSSDKTPRYPA